MAGTLNVTKILRYIFERAGSTIRSLNRFGPGDAGYFAFLLLSALLLIAQCSDPGQAMPVQRDQRLHPVAEKTIGTIAAPEGYFRLEPVDGFALYLRNLALLPNNSVHLFNGQKKRNQSAQYRVIDLSVGDKDLQQCADALIRLRAEYLWSVDRFKEIRFRFTSGDPSSYLQWSRGYRPRINGNQVKFRKVATPAHSRAAFMQYLENLFTYAGTISLALDSTKVTGTPVAGDFFLESGSPGHAVMILDSVENKEGHRLYLLGQSYMPAQQFHVLKNPGRGEPVPGNESSGPVWYDLKPATRTQTPEWVFPAYSLRRWKHE